MNMYTLISSLVTLGITLYITFITSYSKKKGENAAQKEDLAKLTHEIEKVKDSFLKEQEILKSQLQKNMNLELSYEHEVRMALISFHGLHSQWLYSINKFDLPNYNYNNLDEFRIEFQQLKNFYSSVGVAKSKISLLCEDVELRNLCEELFSNSLTLHHWAIFKIFEILHSYEQQKLYLDRVDINSPLNSSGVQVLKKFEEMNDRTGNLVTRFYDELNEKTSPVIALQAKFSVMSRSFLKRDWFNS